MAITLLKVVYGVLTVFVSMDMMYKFTAHIVLNAVRRQLYNVTTAYDCKGLRRQCTASSWWQRSCSWAVPMRTRCTLGLDAGRAQVMGST